MTLSLRCKCGSVKGTATDPRMRAICLCDDCQAYAHYLGKADEVLDKNGGTDIFVVAPANLKITHGAEQLKCVRLSGKGMFRWYAGCCKTPIGNSMPITRMPFVGMFSILDHERHLGPVEARVQGKYGIGPLPKGTSQSSPPSFLLKALLFLIPNLIRGRHLPSPFFESDGRPKVAPYVLTQLEREALRPKRV